MASYMNTLILHCAYIECYILPEHISEPFFACFLIHASVFQFHILHFQAFQDLLRVHAQFHEPDVVFEHGIV